MHRSLSPTLIVVILAFPIGGPTRAKAGDPLKPDRRDETSRRPGLDPKSPLISRVQVTPDNVLAMFKELGGPAPTPHTLTEPERRKLSAALDALPPLHRRVLGERLRSLSFLDGMPNTALTSTVKSGDSQELFDITIRAGVLGENVSDWLTQKERTCFDASDSPLSVSIDGGQLDAILYVLLHEGTHIVDASLRLTPAFRPAPEPAPPTTPFTAGIWADRLTYTAPLRSPLLERLRYRAGGKPLPIDQAEAVYAAMRRTPFVSLYGSSNWHDDLAEYVAIYHLTEVLKQPFKISIKKDGEDVSTYEPMKSSLVRGRIDQIKRFYEDKR